MRNWQTPVLWLIVGSVFLVGSTVFGARAAGQGVQADGTEVPRKVMAFYYPWYGIAEGPGGAGRTVHWGKIEPSRKEIAASTHYPALGAYDSHDPKVIEQHCQWAADAGIDTFIVSWWGQGDYTDKPMSTILDACGRHGMTACIYYETVPQPRSPETAARDIVRVMEKYASHPAHLKIDGEPVVFVYGRAMGELGLTGWMKAIDWMDEKLDGGIACLGDQFSYGAARLFDGLHTYNTAGSLRGMSLAESRKWCAGTYRSWVELAEDADAISTITIIPGYDDTKIRKPGLAVERFEGQLYRVQWENAIQANPRWILITSFNEWHEGSEIEPSAEFGDVYLKITRDFANRFKAQAVKAGARSSRSRLAPDEKTGLARKYLGRRIATLADLDSMAFWWLRDLGIEMDVLSWQQVADGILTTGQYDIALYCGGETYRRSVHKAGDVDGALAAYLENGGTLVAAPAMPWPFYYDQDGHPVQNSRLFGLTIRMGWENPPAGTQLEFKRLAPSMKHTPDRFDFPTSGDLRWRAFFNEGHKAYTPLLQLRNSKGESLGDGAAYAELQGGGRVVSIWFTLLNGPYAEPILYDVFDFLAGRLTAPRSQSSRPAARNRAHHQTVSRRCPDREKSGPEKESEPFIWQRVLTPF
ncbi:MAG: glycoside hydrolase family 99-like domain-containing protein [Pirellulales bacterium]|nr:glycoside hydrolase family 99-like domain-containing protein [Pirellulales bacterium]